MLKTDFKSLKCFIPSVVNDQALHSNKDVLAARGVSNPPCRELPRILNLASCCTIDQSIDRSIVTRLFGKATEEYYSTVMPHRIPESTACILNLFAKAQMYAMSSEVPEIRNTRNLRRHEELIRLLSFCMPSILDPIFSIFTKLFLTMLPGRGVCKSV